MKRKSGMVISLIVSFIYIVYYYFCIRYIVEKEMLIGPQQVTWDNIGTKIILDFFLMLLFPIILFVVYRKKGALYNILSPHRRVQFILSGIMFALFLLHGDYSISGYYSFFFYLVVVSFGEEFFFRGYVYCMLKRYNKVFAIVVSGILWGGLHAVMPGLISDDNLGRIGIDMVSQFGFGIGAGYYFIYLMEKSKSLSIPILVHAILNYTVGPIGILTSLGTGLYFLLQKDLKNMKNIEHET